MAAGTKKPDHTGARQAAGGPDLTSRQVIFIMAGLLLLNLLLRVFYLRYDFVNGDEGVRALTAARVLEGARLYGEIVTDKPPGTTLFYAVVFRLFGRSMQAVHLVAAMWNFATSAVIYLTGARLYGRRVGVWAALLFVYFSTNYHTQDMMAANTEMLMALPLAASFYFFIGADNRQGSRYEAAGLLAAGALAGLATVFKQVGVFNLLFFAICEIFAVWGASYGARLSIRRPLKRLLLIGTGFMAVLALVALWLAGLGVLPEFWRYVVKLGMFYIGALPRDLWIKFMIGRTVGYILLNGALWWLAVWAVARSIRRVKSGKPGDARLGQAAAADMTVALWGAVSLLAVFTGGRFFGHYFIQVLPSLSLLGSRGMELLGDRLGDPARRRRAQIAVAALALLFLVGMVRFHHRTAVLAYETLTGKRTSRSEGWGMTERESEARQVVSLLRERIGPGEPLYIWGYGLDVYWQSGCRPASRYLAPYYITGHFPESTESLDKHGGEFWREARAHLIEDLENARPRLILDAEGSLESLPYPEITGFIKRNYIYEGKIGPHPARPFHVFRLK